MHPVTVEITKRELSMLLKNVQDFLCFLLINSFRFNSFLFRLSI